MLKSDCRDGILGVSGGRLYLLSVNDFQIKFAQFASKKKKTHPFLTAFSADSIWNLKIMLC